MPDISISIKILNRSFIVKKTEPLRLEECKPEEGYGFSSYEAFCFLEKYYDKRLEVNCHDLDNKIIPAQEFMESYKGFMENDCADGLHLIEGRVHSEPWPEFNS